METVNNQTEVHSDRPVIKRNQQTTMLLQFSSDYATLESSYKKVKTNYPIFESKQDPLILPGLLENIPPICQWKSSYPNIWQRIPCPEDYKNQHKPHFRISAYRMRGVNVSEHQRISKINFTSVKSGQNTNMSKDWRD